MGETKIKLCNFDTKSELSEIRIIYKPKQKPTSKISNSRAAYEILIDLYNRDTIEYLEQFFVLFLNRANMVLGWILLSQGGTTGTVVDSKVIFSLALATNAHSIILSHNHPSGNLIPSESDIQLTKNLKKAGEIIGVDLLDHLIISSDDKFYSFADDGLI